MKVTYYENKLLIYILIIVYKYSQRKWLFEKKET